MIRENLIREALERLLMRTLALLQPIPTGCASSQHYFTLGDSRVIPWLSVQFGTCQHTRSASMPALRVASCLGSPCELGPPEPNLELLR